MFFMPQAPATWSHHLTHARCCEFKHRQTVGFISPLLVLTRPRLKASSEAGVLLPGELSGTGCCCQGWEQAARSSLVLAWIFLVQRLPCAPGPPVCSRYPAEWEDLDRMEFFLSLLCLRTLPTMFFLIQISFRNLLPEGFPSPSQF